MNRIKKVYFFSLLIMIHHLYTQTTVDESNIEALSSQLAQTEKEIDSLAATASNKIEEEEEEKTALTEWDQHLASLLVKDAFWNAANNTPDDEWIDKAVTLAYESLKNNINNAEYLKSSFSDTINDKYTNIEKGLNLLSIVGVINNFNQAIDDFVRELSPKEEKEEIIQNNDAVEKNLAEDEIRETFFDTAESNRQETETSKKELSEEEKEEKKKQKQQNQWLECLKDIKNEGPNEDEAEGIIKETIDAATQLVSSAQDKQETIDTLKKELKEALETRENAIGSGEKTLYSININQTMSLFTQKMNSLIIQDEQQFAETPSVLPVTEPVLPRKRTQQQLPRESYQEPTQKEELISTEKEVPIPKEKTTVSSGFMHFAPPQEQSLLNTRLEMARKEQAEKERKESIQRNQKLVAERIQEAVKQKAEKPSAAVSESVTSSMITRLFNPWAYRGTSEQKVADVRPEDPFIEQMLKNKQDLSTESKEQIKTAYRIFKDTLLAFDNAYYWNDTEKAPNAKWLDKIRSAITVLLQYDIMTTETAIAALDNAFKTKKSLTIEEYNNLTNKIITQNLEPYLKEQTAQITQEKENIERKKQAEEIRLFKEIETREKREQQKKKSEKQQQKNREREFDQFQRDWEGLLKDIKDKKNATTEDNKQFVIEALENSQALFTILPLIKPRYMITPTGEKKIVAKEMIIQERMADISNAFLEQQKGKDHKTHVNIFPDIERFNRGIHELH